jgi:Ca-activated chloride channel family protein
MTDGESFDQREDVLAAARKARESGVALVFVGFGTEEGTTIPVPTSRGTELKRDENGQVVVTHADPRVLRAAAEAGEGTYIAISATDKAARIRQALAQLRRRQRLTDAGRSREQRYQLFLIPALLLLFADTLLAERRRRHAGHAAATTAAAAAALVLLMILPRAAMAAPGDAERLYREGRYAEAAALWRRAIAEGDTTARTAYNLGTALLEAGKPDDAIEPLEHATSAADPEVRFRALFNLGLLFLERGRAAEKDSAGGDASVQAYAAAKDLYKRALRLRSSDLDAKWNYELSNERQKESGGGGGGNSGGGGGADQKQQRQSQKPQPQPTPAGGLDPRQAERLLNSAAREERDVQGRRQQQAKSQRPPLGKDW